MSKFVASLAVAGALVSGHASAQPAKPTIVLVHGAFADSSSWNGVTKILQKDGYRVVAAANPLRSVSTDAAYVSDIVASIEGQVVLVGHSYGGFVALLAALAAPVSVRSLTMFEPVAFGCLDRVADADARVELAAVDFVWGATPEDHDRWLAMFGDYWSGAGAWAALREEARADFRRVGWVVCQGVTSLVADDTPASAYRAISAPVRLLSAERSPLAARRVVQRLGETLPQSTVVTIPKAGHMAPLSHAEQVNAAILDALAAAEALPATTA